MAERVIYRGQPGTYWTNHLDMVHYQHITALDGACGVCLQYHTAISRAWPIPLHKGCRCNERAIKPGQRALLPFCDFRKLLDEMDDAGKQRAIGITNYRLLTSGLVEWKDIVTSNCVIRLDWVMQRKRLSVAQIVAASGSRSEAEAAQAIIDRDRAAVPRIPTLVLRPGQ
jgi:hypothetical protein